MHQHWMKEQQMVYVHYSAGHTRMLENSLQSKELNV